MYRLNFFLSKSSRSSRPICWPAQKAVFLVALAIASPGFTQTVGYSVDSSSAEAADLTLRLSADDQPTGRVSRQRDRSASGLVEMPSFGLVVENSQLFQIVGIARAPELRTVEHKPGFDDNGPRSGQRVKSKSGRLSEVLAASGNTALSSESETVLRVDSLDPEWQQRIAIPQGYGLVALSPNGTTFAVSHRGQAGIAVYGIVGDAAVLVRTLPVPAGPGEVDQIELDNHGRLLLLKTRQGSIAELYASREGLAFQRITSLSEHARLVVDPGGAWFATASTEDRRVFEYRTSTFGFTIANAADYAAEQLESMFPIPIAGHAGMIGIRNGSIVACAGPAECSVWGSGISSIEGVDPTSTPGGLLVRTSAPHPQLVLLNWSDGDLRSRVVAVRANRQGRRSSPSREPIRRE